MSTLDLGAARWRTSSYSSDSNTCVEVAFADPAWRKSSYSTNTSNCVEVAFAGRAVAVRDSKHPGGTLAVSERAWSAFVRTTTGDAV